MSLPSFFTKSKQTNHFKFSKTKGKKRKFEKISRKDEELTSSDEEDTKNHKVYHSSSEDEKETAQDKKTRLAKICLNEIEKEEKRRLEDKEISSNIISQRLKEDHLKDIGKYKFTIADKLTEPNNEDVRLLKCKEQKNSITCICLSSDDKWLFSGSKDGIIVKWCLTEFKKIGIIPFIKKNGNQIKGHSSSILSLALSTDKKFLVVGDKSSDIQIWNPSNLQHVNTLKGHRSSVTGVCFKQNSYTLYSCSNDRSVRVWSLDEMLFVETLFGHQDSITSIDVLNNERPVTSGGKDGTLRIWKIIEESQLIYNAHPCNVDTVKFINDRNFVSGGDDGQLSVWSLLKKKPICSVKTAHGCNATNSEPHWISSVTALQNSDLVASGSQDGFVRFWKLGEAYRSISELFKVPLPGFVNSLVFTSDGKYVIAGCGKDHKLGRWSTIKTAKNCLYIIRLRKI